MRSRNGAKQEYSRIERRFCSVSWVRSLIGQVDETHEKGIYTLEAAKSMEISFV